MGIGPESMNDKDLADRVVAFGCADFHSSQEFGQPLEQGYMTPNGAIWETEESLLEDWSVAGALQEKCLRIVIHRVSDGWTVTAINDRDEGITVFNESLPRAIVEACVEALSESTYAI